MKGKFHNLFLSLIVILLFVVGCSATDDGDSTIDNSIGNVNIVKNAFIDIPSAISESESDVSSIKDNTTDYIYDKLRNNVYTIENYIPTLKEMTDLMHSAMGADFGMSYAVGRAEVQKFNSDSSNNLYEIEWKPAPSNDVTYDQLVEIYLNEHKMLQAFITIGDEMEATKGMYILDLDGDGDTTDNNLLKVRFDSSPESKYMEFWINDYVNGIQNMDNTSDEISNLKSAWFKIEESSSDITNIFGRLSFSNLDLFKDESNDISGDMDYVFAATGYTGNNEFILTLAIHPNDITIDSLVWSDYRIDKVYVKNIALIWDIDENDVIKELIQPYWSHYDADNMTFVRELINPAYFNSCGFIGTYVVQYNIPRIDIFGRLWKHMIVPNSFDGLDVNDATVDYNYGSANNKTIDFIKSFVE
jgi:hypothetical protein